MRILRTIMTAALVCAVGRAAQAGSVITSPAQADADALTCPAVHLGKRPRSMEVEFISSDGSLVGLTDCQNQAPGEICQGSGYPYTGTFYCKATVKGVSSKKIRASLIVLDGYYGPQLFVVPAQ